MTDQQIKDAIRGLIKSSTKGDTKQALTFFADDAVWVTSHYFFQGQKPLLHVKRQ
jgi:acid phosphatase class B